MDRYGCALRAGILEQAAARGIEVNYTGPAAMPYLTFPGDREHQLGAVFAAAAVRSGLYLHPRHNWFISAATTDADLAKALAATEQAFAAVQARQLEGGIT
jgi:glutamate-1-semialdehyde 2,1-aminomutase